MAEIIFMIVCFLQPICIPLPEIATITAGSMMFGSFSAFIFGWLGTVLGILTMFTICKITVKNLQTRRANTKQIIEIDDKKINKYKYYVKDNEVFFTALLFILPIMPDEIICVGAAFIGISFKAFITLTLITKSIAVFVVAYADLIGSVLALSRWHIIAIECVVLLVAAKVMKEYKRKKNGKITAEDEI